MSDALDIVERLSDLSADHGPDDWPAVQMRDIAALCGEVERLHALSAQPAAVPTVPYMPILGTPFAVRMDSLNEQQAMKNHGQTLRRLAERGGLGMQEAAAVAERRSWRSQESAAEAAAALIAAAPQAPQQGTQA